MSSVVAASQFHHALPVQLVLGGGLLFSLMRQEYIRMYKAAQFSAHLSEGGILQC